MALVKKNPKYTILHSSYIVRLIKRFNLVRYDVTATKITLATHDPEDGYPDQQLDDEDYQSQDDDPQPLFICIEKNAIYASPHLDIAETQLDIFKILAVEYPKGSFTGMIVFKNNGHNAYSFVNFLGNQDFCGAFGVDNVTIYNSGPALFAIEFELDGESG